MAKNILIIGWRKDGRNSSRKNTHGILTFKQGCKRSGGFFVFCRYYALINIDKIRLINYLVIFNG